MQTGPKTYTKTLVDPSTNIVAGMDEGMMEIFKMETAKYWQMEIGRFTLVYQVKSKMPG